jgi:hypothetical protein
LPEVKAVLPLLQTQARWSRLPAADGLLVERVQSRDGHHAFLFPFAGRLVHEGLAALVAWRIAQRKPGTFTMAATDWGFELSGREPFFAHEREWRQMLSPANLLEDLKAAEDLERIRLLFGDLETKKDVVDLLSRAEQGEGVRIFIGSENKLFSLSGSSMIAAPFRDPTQRIVGVLGVIGPTRLNYARVVPMVDYTARAIVRLMQGR